MIKGLEKEGQGKTMEPTFIHHLQPFLQQAWKNSTFEHSAFVQEKVIPAVLDGRDVIAVAPTGSGKTLAYLLPVLDRMDPGKQAVQAVILAPSKELVMQIQEEAGKWSQGSGIQSIPLIGGANVKRQIEKLKRHPHLVIGTPGRILELIRQKKLKMHEVKMMVLDEGDQLLGKEYSLTVGQIVKSAMRDCQILLFSATLPDATAQKAIDQMKEPLLIRIAKEEARSPVEHIYIVTGDPRGKIEQLRKIARMGVRGLVFFNNKWDVSVAAEKLRFKGLAVAELHGDMRKEEREKSIRLFQNGDVPLLLATDVAARGLDIPVITHVIQFDLPGDVSAYVHRSGRTGRLGSNAGTVVSLVTPGEEKVLKKFAKAQHVELGRKDIKRGELVDPE